MPEGPRIGHGKNLTILAALVGGIAVVMIGIAVVIAMGQDSDVDMDGPATPNADANDGDSTDVTITLRAEITGSRLMVEGDITVPDGALVRYEIVGPDDCAECRAAGRTPVSNQTFRVSYDLSNWPDSDSIRVWTAFQTVLDEAEQPSHVIERYGELGERMTGDTVQADGYTRVEAETTVSR